MTTDIVLRTYEELHITAAKNDSDVHHCDLHDSEGNACNFQGTLVSLGQHKWYAHGLCNPAKGLVITNECPACRTVFANLKSAKYHAYTAYKVGKCPDGNKAARPFISEITVERVDKYQCHICKHYLEGHERIQEHLRGHFEALLTQAPAPATQPSAPSDEPGGKQVKKRRERQRTKSPPKGSRRRHGPDTGHGDGRPAQEHGDDDGNRRDGTIRTDNPISLIDELDHERTGHCELEQGLTEVGERPKRKVKPENNMGMESKRKKPIKDTARDGLLKQLTISAMFAKAFTPSQGMMMQTYYDTPMRSTEASIISHIVSTSSFSPSHSYPTHDPSHSMSGSGGDFFFDFHAPEHTMSTCNLNMTTHFKHKQHISNITHKHNAANVNIRNNRLDRFCSKLKHMTMNLIRRIRSMSTTITKTMTTTMRMSVAHAVPARSFCQTYYESAPATAPTRRAAATFTPCGSAERQQT